MRPEHLRGADALRRALDDSCREGQVLVLCSTHEVVRATVLQASLELRARMDVRSSRKLAEWLTSLVGYDTLVLIEPTQHRRKDDERLKKLLAGSKVKFVTVTDRSFAPTADISRLEETRPSPWSETEVVLGTARIDPVLLQRAKLRAKWANSKVWPTPLPQGCTRCNKKQECSHVSCPNRKPLTAFAPYHPDEKPELSE